MTEFENQDPIINEEENEPVSIEPAWSEEDVKNNQEWMRKSKRKIITFILFTVMIILFVVLFHSNQLFIFNVDSTSGDLTATTILFNILSYVFIIITFVYMFFYLSYYQKRVNMSETEQMESFSGFKKHFNAFDLLGVVPVFLAFLTFVNGIFLGFATVIGPSMEPTFCPGDYVVIEHFRQDYVKDDIIIFIHMDSKLIKRLVGVPGDRLVVNSTGVYINDILVETYAIGSFIPYNTTIPDGSYYLLGDNRLNSNDSRYFGLVSIDLILGEVVMKVSNSTCEIS